MNLPPEQIGATPQMGVNPMAKQSANLSPEQLAVLRKDPEIAEAVSKFAGRPIPVQSIPDNLLMEIAGMIHKLGVDGAVMEFKRKVPPQVQAQLMQGLGT